MAKKIKWTEEEAEQLRIIEDCVVNMLRCLQDPPEDKHDLIDLISTQSDILCEAEEELDSKINPENYHFFDED